MQRWQFTQGMQPPLSRWQSEPCRGLEFSCTAPSKCATQLLDAILAVDPSQIRSQSLQASWCGIISGLETVRFDLRSAVSFEVPGMLMTASTLVAESTQTPWGSFSSTSTHTGRAPHSTTLDRSLHLPPFHVGGSEPGLHETRLGGPQPPHPLPLHRHGGSRLHLPCGAPVRLPGGMLHTLPHSQ